MEIKVIKKILFLASKGNETMQFFTERWGILSTVLLLLFIVFEILKFYWKYYRKFPFYNPLKDSKEDDENQNNNS